MDDESKKALARMACAQEKIALLMGKPESKLIKALTIGSLSASFLGTGIFTLIQWVIKLFGGA